MGAVYLAAEGVRRVVEVTGKSLEGEPATP
jgi:hypothetical protein